MNLLKYINGVLFIDDKKDDVDKLYSYFEKYNVPCMFINPNEYDGEISSTIGFARFVFLDIEFMNGTPNLVDIVSLLRDLSEKGMENVVLIMWTLHDDDDCIDELISLINEKMKKSKPVLIFNANKRKFLELDNEDFNQQLENLLLKKIEDEPQIFKMLEWEKSCNIATYKTFNDIVQMSYKEEKQSFEISNALSNMASQNIPNNKISSSFDTANSMLVDKIKHEVELIGDVELNENENPEFLRKMNYYMMFFTTGLRDLHPGNIYINDGSLCTRLENIMDECNINEQKRNPIFIDLTPGCSFAHSNSIILLNGIIAKDITEEERKRISNKIEKKVFLKDAYIDNEGKINYFIVDCLEVSSIEKSQFELSPIMCLKDSYRVSIQQQFGNYLARIGDNIYHNKK